MIIWHWSKGN